MTNDNKFERYYYILRTIVKVLDDAYMIYNMGLKSERYIDVMPRIVNYYISDDIMFPEFVEE